MVPSGLRTPFPEASIVFRRASLIGEAGENNVIPAVFHKARRPAEVRPLHPVKFRSYQRRSKSGLKLSFHDVVAHKRDAFLAWWERRTAHVVAFDSGVLLFLLLLTSGEAQGQQTAENKNIFSSVNCR